MAHSGLKSEIKILQSNKFIRYNYGDEKTIANKSQLMGDIHLRVNTKNALEIGKRYLKNLQKKWSNTPIYCPALDNKQVIINQQSIDHLIYSSQGKRWGADIKNRVKLLPYIDDIINKGILYEITEQKKGQLFDYGLVCRAMVNRKEQIIKIVLAEIKKGTILLYLSIL